jgi:hypothetical protein
MAKYPLMVMLRLLQNCRVMVVLQSFSGLQQKEAQHLSTLTNKVTAMFKRLLKNRKGTAEVIGSVLFIIILIFFFTNVYLWHDAATKEMNELQLEKMNSGMSMKLNEITGTLDVTDSGGLDIDLSRVWIIEERIGGSHLYANLEPLNVHIPAGNTIQVTFESQRPLLDGSVQVDWQDANNKLIIYYDLPADNPVRIRILNTLGITTAYLYS